MGKRSEASPARMPKALPTSLETERLLSWSWVKDIRDLREEE